jgi:hypothetical protein
MQSVYKGHTVCSRIDFTRGSKFLILIVRKNFRGITFFVKMFMLLILLQLTLLFDNHLITVRNNFKMLSLEQRIYVIQCWTSFRHIITKFNEKFPNIYVSRMGVQKLIKKVSKN